MNQPVFLTAILPLLAGVGILFLLVLLGRLIPGSTDTKIVEERTPLSNREKRLRKAAYRQGIWVLLFLALLTIFEFMAAHLNSAVLMFLIILLKGGVILYFFMHVTSVWRAEEAH